MSNCIYGIYDKEDNLFYIGSTIDLNRRKGEHISCAFNNNKGSYNSQLYIHIRKMGVNNIQFRIIEDNCKYLLQRENEIINKYMKSNVLLNKLKNYSIKECIIYSIKNIENVPIYIGRTINIKQRIRRHRSDTNKRVNDLYKYFFDYGFDNLKFEIIERLPEDENDRIEEIEKEYIRNNRETIMNKVKYLTEEELNEHKKIKNKKYVNKNRQKLNEQSRKRYEENKEEILRKQKEVYEENKEEIQKHRREDRKNNPEKYKLLDKKWKNKNPVKVYMWKKVWFNNNKVRVNKQNRRKRGKIINNEWIENTDYSHYLKTIFEIGYIENYLLEQKVLFNWNFNTNYGVVFKRLFGKNY